jgi:hypothetical protein
MRSHTVFLTLSVCSTVVISSALIARGGPLTPPAPGGGGAIQPTYKTLTEVEPRTLVNSANTPGDADSVYKITQPGSYYLGGPLTGASGKSGIEIAAANVTLDLNGCTLTGGANSLYAVTVTAGFPLNIAVRDGALESWALGGVNGQGATGMRIERILATFMGGTSIVSGSGATVLDCTVTLSTGAFNIGPDSVIERCVARQTVSGDGFLIGPNTIVRDSVASSGAANGFRGFSSSANGRVFVGCTAVGNAASGFVTGAAATMENCTASENDIGVLAGEGTVIRGCVAESNAATGFSGTRLTIESCVANDNNGSGFLLGSLSSIIASTSTSNGGDGVSCNSNVTVRDCDIRINGGHGVAIVSGCLVQGNTITVNNLALAAGAGVFVSGDSNHIEGNLVEENDIAFDVNGANTLLIRNHARANGQNYAQVGAGNFLGTVVTSTATMNAAANGNVNWSF